jgi:cell division septation protein DedD
MTRTENEQEFVLGNKQLLSAFFVVVCLLGVFFVMGYIVGSNTNGSAKKAAQTEPPPASASAAAPVQDSAPSAPPPQDATPAQTAPAQPEPAKPESAKPEAAEKADAPSAEKPVEKPSSRIESAPGHTYLQVSAVKRPAADSIVQTLKDKGFPALLGESSKPSLFRVLVGPYADTESLSKAKSDLKAMGFDAVVSK